MLSSPCIANVGTSSIRGDGLRISSGYRLSRHILVGTAQLRRSFRNRPRKNLIRDRSTRIGRPRLVGSCQHGVRLADSCRDVASFVSGGPCGIRFVSGGPCGIRFIGTRRYDASLVDRRLCSIGFVSSRRYHASVVNRRLCGVRFISGRQYGVRLVDHRR
ncbi:hypothetical protein Kfla_2582 [Kribbella flavida DSM 17836]|uniref:Uncharacterized protein n=2 Tax=Kribbella flavida TaxID=182640 RepID=D2PXK8_KRIFD|nr:hypothetical protein Kfla_2582 [Kribbella flavida DSM 17836]